jgi:hypothetical protein
MPDGDSTIWSAGGTMRDHPARLSSADAALACPEAPAWRAVPFSGWRRSLAWFRKCHFQVTPEIDRALRIKRFLVLGVTLI